MAPALHCTIDRNLANKTEYLVCCIADFARLFKLKNYEAYAYLRKYLGIDYLLRHYEALHTLSIDEAVEDLIKICKRNGGGLEI